MKDYERSRIYHTQGRYWFVYYLAGRRQHKRLPEEVRTQRAAEVWADRWLAVEQDRNRTGPTLREYAEGWFLPGSAWVERKRISAPWAKARRAFLNAYILPRWGELALMELDPITVETELLDLKLSGKTRNAIRDTLIIMVREARRQRLIPANPLDEIERLPEDPRERAAFSLEEIKALFPDNLAPWNPPYGLIGYLMYCSGERSQEVRALTHKAIRPGGVLVLQAVKVAGGLGPTKNEDTRATLITDRAVDYLKSYRGGQELLFPGRDGPLTHSPFEAAFTRATKAVGMEPGDRWLTPHSLRHTWRTEMRRLELARKIDKGSVDYMMGHRSEGVAARYIHLRPEEALEVLQEYRPALNQALA